MEELAALSAEKRKLALTRFLLIEHTLSVAKERRSVRASESPRTTHNPKISTTNNFSSYMLGMLERAAVLEVIGDAGGPHRMIACSFWNYLGSGSHLVKA